MLCTGEGCRVLVYTMLFCVFNVWSRIKKICIYQCVILCHVHVDFE